MMDILDGAGQDGAFRLLAVPIRYNSSKLVDTLVDVPSATALYLFLDMSKKHQKKVQR